MNKFTPTIFSLLNVDLLEKRKQSFIYFIGTLNYDVLFIPNSTALTHSNQKYDCVLYKE